MLSYLMEMLAVEVRYLDAYIKWKDLVYQEDHCHDGKVVDKEGISFRNSIYYGKRYEGGEAGYLLDFGNQKDLIVIVMSTMGEEQICSLKDIEGSM